MLTDSEVRARYGADVLITRKRGFVLVHLDRPDAAVAAARTDAFDPEEYFDPGCPLCALQRTSGIFLFDEDPDDEAAEEILLE